MGATFVKLSLNVQKTQGIENAVVNPPTTVVGGKIGRNDPCPCGAINPNTGKIYKYKHCGLIAAPHHKGA